jgi:membrane protein YdbS with pleckstrin-like domain
VNGPQLGNRVPFELNADKKGIKHMALILLVLLLALLLGGLGFAVHILWWIALIVLVVWVLGFLIRVGEGGARSRYRWYRW